MKKSYSDYTVKVSSEPSYYGSDCTQSDADKIVANLKKMVQAEFSGIQVIDYVGGRGSSATAGPDQSVVDQVDHWIEKNWLRPVRRYIAGADESRRTPRF